MTLPDGPKIHPILQIAQWLKDPLDYMEKADAQFDGIFTVRWGGVATAVMLSRPEAIATMLTSPAITAPGEISRIGSPIIGNNSAILMSGDLHKRRRKLLMPAFHGQKMYACGQSISKIATRVVEGWKADRPFEVFTPRSIR